MDTPESGRPPRILIADDASMIRVMGRDALEECGFEVIEAEDGAAAVSAFEEEAPDLVLLDVEMPRLDGFGACERICSQQRDRHVPVVMMTSRDDLQSIHRAYEAGATDFVTKPVNWVIVSHRLRYMLRAGALRDRLQRSEERLAWAQRVASLGNWECDLASGELTGSRELRRILGFRSQSDPLTLEAMLGRVHPEDRELLRGAIDQTVLEGRPLRIDHRITLPDGGVRYVHLQAEALSGDGDRAVRIAGVAQDITRRKRAEAEIRFLAYHDSLTRLANRRLFKEHLKRSLARARRRRGCAALLFIDLDHFKRINDTLGHSMGDLLLQRVADRLAKCIRETDCISRNQSEETDSNVSRFGGDEFIILLDQVADADAAGSVAQRVLDVLAPPMVLHDQEVVISASIGIAIAPRDGESVDGLLRRADAAMYHAKESGRNNYQLFEESLQPSSRARLALESDLRRAIERGEIQVHYQPRVDMGSGQPTGFEALARWHHAELGMIPPGEFVPIAEESGLIAALGDLVLRRACVQARLWAESGMGNFRVSVNLSPLQFKNQSIFETVQRILAETGLSPGFLELEITESTLIENEEMATEALRALKGIGISVSLDDFGTGYSSLSYLKRFPVDTVKIDRSFVRDIPNDADDAAIVAAIISMAQALNLQIVAEGVETEEQRAFLSDRGCNEIQGFLVSPAVPADSIEELIGKEEA